MRIAVVQCFSIPDDACRAGDVIVDRLRWADQEGVSLTIFPEAFLLGHSYDPETIRSRASRGISAIAALCERVAAFRSTLVVGTFDLVYGQVFNSAFEQPAALRDGRSLAGEELGKLDRPRPPDGVLGGIIRCDRHLG